MTGVPPPPPLDFTALFEAAAQPCVVLTTDYRVIAVNNAYLRSTLTRREDLVGRSLLDALPPRRDIPSAARVHHFRESLARVTTLRRPDRLAIESYEVHQSAAEGGSVEVRHWIPVNEPLLSADGTIVAIVHRIDDVTDVVRLKHLANQQHRMMDELRSHTEQIEAEIYLRTEELDDARRHVRVAQGASDTLCDVIAHDLRGPVRGLLEDVSALDAALISQPRAEHLDACVARIAERARAIDEHVTIARELAISTHAECVREPIDVTRLVMEVARRIASTPAVPIDVDRLPACEADPALLGQAILRLLEEATECVRDAPYGRVRVVGARDDAGRTVYTVRATARASPASVVDETRTPRERRAAEIEAGALRLAIAQRIIARHGGHLWIDVDVDGGLISSFTVGPSGHER